MEVLAIIAVVATAGYLVSLRLWPETYCRSCGGSGRNPGSNRQRWGRCRRCGGSGRKPRPGARLLASRSRSRR